MKKELRKFLSDPINRSKRIHLYRGTVDKANPFWKICEDQNEGTITYQFDPENMSLIKLLSSCDGNVANGFVRYLKELSKNMPINHIYQKMSESPKDVDQESIDEDLIDSILDRAMAEFMMKNKGTQ